MLTALALQLTASFGIPEFRGEIWNGLKLNGMTRREVGLKYGEQEAPIMSSAVRVETDGTARVDCLFEDEGSDAKLRAIRLEIPKDGGNAVLPSSPPVRLYPCRRYEDWLVWVWPDRGIAAVAVKGKVSEILITSLDRMPLIKAGFSLAPTPIYRTDYKPNSPVQQAGDTGDGWTDSINRARDGFTSSQWWKMLPPRPRDDKKAAEWDREFESVARVYAPPKTARGYWEDAEPYRWAEMGEVYQNLVIPINPDR